MVAAEVQLPATFCFADFITRWMVLNIKLIVWLVRSCGQRCFCHADSRAWTDKGYLLGEDIGNIFCVPYRTKILLLPPYPSKTRPVKFQSKNRREKAARTTNNLLHSGLVSAHPHKIHPDITPQSRKITD